MAMAENGIKTTQDDLPKRILESKSILVLEDEYFIAFDLRNTLVDNGAEVVGPISEPDTALEIIGTGRTVDAAIIDINLHGEMSFPVVDELIKRDIPVMFMTGYDGSVVPYRLRHVPRCQKPLNSDRVIQAIIELIGDDA